MSDTYPHLLSPMQLGPLRLRNRVAFASMFSGRARGGEVTPELIQFFANRAAGGAALIVSEPVAALKHVAAFGAQVGVYRREKLDGLERWANAVHQHGSFLLAQLQEPGRGDVRPQRKPYSFSSSALPDDLSWTVPHAMSLGEIDQVREEFTAAARTVQRAGFDGVEISSGHGHLYHQFLSPWLNRREDDYGGSLENRVRALAELIRSIRETCGPSFVLGVRVPGHDGLQGSIDWEEAGRIADTLTRTARPDYVNFVQGGQAWTLHMHVPDMHMARGTYVEEIAKLQAFTNAVPVACTGRIVEPVQAEALLARGQADFVMLGRTLLADPAWLLKAAQGRDGEIRKCVSCNNCWGEIVHLAKPLACDNNPRVAKPDEVDFWPRRTSHPRRITVVGGGIAGLEAAWVAAAGGNEVVLFSQSGDLGGKSRLHASLPGCEAVSSVFDYQLTAIRKARVQLELSHEVNLDGILATRPDVVIVATGGEMIWPRMLPLDWRELGVIPDLWTTLRELPRMRKESGTAVLYDFDGTDVTYSTAEALADRFEHVVILNPVESLARDEALVKRQATYRRLFDRGVGIRNWSEPSPASDLEQGRFVVRNVMTGRESTLEDVAFFTYATPRRPRDSLVAQLAGLGIETHVIGDACIPRPAMATLREAHDLGERLCVVTEVSSALSARGS